MAAAALAVSVPMAVISFLRFAPGCVAGDFLIATCEACVQNYELFAYFDHHGTYANGQPVIFTQSGQRTNEFVGGAVRPDAELPK